MNVCLERYEPNEEIVGIAAHKDPRVGLDYDTVFLSRGGPGSWGWGTWKKYWMEFLNYDAETCKQGISKLCCKENIDLRIQVFFEEMAPMPVWDTEFMAFSFSKGWLSAIPNRSLSMNIGLDGTGDHCPTDKDFYKQFSLATECPILPNSIKNDPRYLEVLVSILDAAKDHSKLKFLPRQLRSLKKRKDSLKRKVLNRLFKLGVLR